MNRLQKITIVVGAVLALGIAGLLVAQDKPDTGQQTMTQQRQGVPAETGQQGVASLAGATHTRRLGPGDGTGNQGASPADGTGFGSPGRLGSSSNQGARANGATGQAGKKGSAASSGVTSGMRQSRARSISGSGPGGALCDGTGRHATAGASRSSRRGGGGGSRR